MKRRKPNPIVYSVFMSLLGLCSLVAFVSYWAQLKGLIGSRGITPAELLIGAAGSQLGTLERWLEMPTLAWISAGDAALNCYCGAGVALSILLLAGVRRRLCCLGLWALYLTLSNVDQVFLSFQWDILLIETLFLGVLISPERLFLVRWLLFKLMFSSGACKLASHDPAWSSLRALSHHFETQPLPTWLGWYAHQLPAWALTAATASMFFVELPLPFLAFTRQKHARRLAFAAIAGLQLVIMLTGNYGFFNLLSIVLCLSLLDDAELARALPSGMAARLRRARAPAPRWLAKAYPLIVFLVVGAGLVEILPLVSPSLVPLPLRRALAAVAPFRTINGYGLFAVMTTERDEITIEGSADGRQWSAYDFRYKPGPVDRAPGFVEPYQPRLDWQMWFAALGDFDSNPWLRNTMIRLLQGSAETIALLARNPFPVAPPRYVRAIIGRYRFTTPEERRRTGAWWARDAQRPYSPVLSLGGGTL